MIKNLIVSSCDSKEVLNKVEYIHTMSDKTRWNLSVPQHENLNKTLSVVRLTYIFSHVQKTSHPTEYGCYLDLDIKTVLKSLSCSSKLTKLLFYYVFWDTCFAKQILSLKVVKKKEWKERLVCHYFSYF
jgi:hypothetical protein